MRRAAALALALLAACGGGGEPTFTVDDLPRLVLREDDAPVGTQLEATASGFQTLEEYAEDEAEEAALASAGFRGAQIAFFLDPKVLGSGGGTLAVSFALLFDDADGARAGLDVVRDDLVADGEDLTERPAPGLGDGAFGYYGDLSPGRPPGYAFVWRVGNAVLAVVGAAPDGAVNEGAVLTLANAVDARARG